MNFKYFHFIPGKLEQFDLVGPKFGKQDWHNGDKREKQERKMKILLVMLCDNIPAFEKQTNKLYFEIILDF